MNTEGISDAGTLLRTGGAIWLTNVIVFSLWYWLFDRGGPYARAQQPDPFPAFMFPQMEKHDFVPPGWKPEYVDYLYLAFTNALAFSPTDVMPLKHWAKLTMLVQSLVSLMIAVPAAALARHAWVRTLWSAYPLLIFFVIVATGNHFWFDAVAGAAVACLAAVGARQLARLRPDVWSWRGDDSTSEATI